MPTIILSGLAALGLAVLLSALLVTPTVLLWEWWQRRKARRALARDLANR